MTPREYARDRRNLIRECHLLTILDMRCLLSGKRVSVTDLFMFSLFALEFVRSEARLKTKSGGALSPLPSPRR